MIRASRHHPDRGASARIALAAALAAALIFVLVVLPDGAVASAPENTHAGAESAIAARAISATDSAKLHYLKSSGSLLYEEGTAHGTLPGSMRAYCNLGSTFTASFTIYTDGSTITGHGTATPHGAGIYESFAGTLTVTGGTGRYLHAHGHAGLYGTFDRRTYAMTVQTTGSLSY